MKKTAVITTGLSKVFGGEKCGGGEILLKNLLSELMQMPDISLSVFTPDEKELTQSIIKKYPKVNFVIYNTSPYTFQYVDELNKIFEKENFDKIINYNMFVPYKTTMLQSHSYIHKLNKTPALFKPFKKKLSQNYINVQQYVFDRSRIDSDFIAVSNIIKEDYSKNFNIPPEKIKVIYPGVNIPEYAKTEKKDCITFGIAANSSVNKGGHSLLAALGLLNLKGGRFKLKIIAPKYNKDILMRFFVFIFGLNKKIEVLPFQEDMTDFYNSIDCMVLPSFNEAFGLVTLEAMAESKPCIVSSSAGSAEIINNDNGVIFNRNSFCDFIQKLDKMIKMYTDDFESYNKMCRCAFETSKHFSRRIFASKVIE